MLGLAQRMGVWRWRWIADSYEPHRVLIGETWARDLVDLARYYGEGKELHLAFNFALATAPFEAPALREVIEATSVALGDDAWPLWTASNHDIGRLATHWAGIDDTRVRCALFVLLMLRGTPVLYAGDEIGLPDVAVPPSRRRDEGTRADGRGRDGGRTPIPWTSGPGGGFTASGVKAWLTLGPVATSVEDQRHDPGSVLHWCRRLIRFRAELQGRSSGSQRMLDAPDGVLAWRLGSELAVAVNLGHGLASVDLAGRIVLASDTSREGRPFDAELEGWGCVILERDKCLRTSP